MNNLVRYCTIKLVPHGCGSLCVGDLRFCLFKIKNNDGVKGVYFRKVVLGALKATFWW